jgi:hypothetical protein
MIEVKVVGWYDEKSGSGNWDFQPKTLLPDAVPTVLRSDFDAQRLRADTAEAELRREKEFHAVNVSESERMLAAAEQRIAEMVGLLRNGIDSIEELLTARDTREVLVDLGAWTINASAALLDAPAVERQPIKNASEVAYNLQAENARLEARIAELENKNK